mgnify:FL=1
MDASQFKTLFLPHSDLLYRTALRLTATAQSAEDLVQDTYLRLWLRREDLPQPLNPAAYSLTVMRHIFYDCMREHHAREIDKPSEDFVLTSDVDVDSQIVNADMADILRHLISKLPDRQRQLMTMRDVEGLDSSQISELTGMSLVNIRTQLCRARTTVRQQFNRIINKDKDKDGRK